jgi:hypothetical protein
MLVLGLPGVVQVNQVNQVQFQPLEQGEPEVLHLLHFRVIQGVQEADMDLVVLQELLFRQELEVQVAQGVDLFQEILTLHGLLSAQEMGQLLKYRRNYVRQII